MYFEAKAHKIDFSTQFPGSFCQLWQTNHLSVQLTFSITVTLSTWLSDCYQGNSSIRIQHHIFSFLPQLYFILRIILKGTEKLSMDVIEKLPWNEMLHRGTLRKFWLGSSSCRLFSIFFLSIQFLCFKRTRMPHYCNVLLYTK